LTKKSAILGGMFLFCQIELASEIKYTDLHKFSFSQKLLDWPLIAKICESETPTTRYCPDSKIVFLTAAKTSGNGENAS
jgi:hypothetical protein